MRRHSWTLLTLSTLALFALSSEAQQNRPADRLALARALYYTPTANGLISFRCTASMDWKDVLIRFGGKDVPANNALLAYLDTVHLSVADDLHGAGTLEWAAATTPPEAIQPNIEQLRGGLEQMFHGFFQTWNPYMNGTMVPAPDASTLVTQVGEETKLHAASGGFTLDELFDKNLLLTQVHVVATAMEVVAYPTYIDTTDGRVVSAIRSTVRQPPTAPPVEITIASTYAKVQTFRLPSMLSFQVQNVGTFVLSLSECAVKTSSKSAIQP
jgi:hypothetical protein